MNSLILLQLDADPAKKQKVFVYQVNPGDVTQVQQVLKEMFDSTSRSSSRSSSSSQNSVLQNRANQNQTTGSGNSGSTFGNSGGGGGSGR